VKTLAIIQARVGSTRLPRKALMDLGGETVLARVIHRLSRSRLVSKLIVATSDSPADIAIVGECQRLGASCFRGSEHDVLDRYYQAARAAIAESVVRITSDCPLIDAELVDDTVRILVEQQADYSSNVFPRSYPRGLDVEVFTMAALDRAWRQAREPHQREHVTPYFYEHPETFKLAFTRNESDYSTCRWTLDTPEDLELLRNIYSRFGNQDNFGWREVIMLMEREPELADLNTHVIQKSVNPS
jgi:spore coat polysaccharide biosynthesis protein SpsF (cytidylyltransferase family)